ncbi:MAG: metalloregulator ArsR/SmtB family transcription factor [Magnetococcus sp. DMHC-6]
METIQEWSLQFKALSEPVRLRLIHLLRGGGEVCVCDLVAVLGMPQSLISRHLATLRHAGWVSYRRQSQWIYYRLAVELNPLQQRILAAMVVSFDESYVFKEDLVRLATLDRDSGIC